MGKRRMVSKEQVEELMLKSFPKCPLCGANKGYEVSGISKNFVQCRSCGAKWASRDFIKCKELKELIFWEPSYDGKGASLKFKSFSVKFWQDKEAVEKAIGAMKTVDSSKLIFHPEMSAQELQNSIESCMAEIASWDWGSTLYGKLGPLISDTSFAEATMIRLLRAIFEQNKILIMQNELIHRTLTQRQKSKLKSSKEKQKRTGKA